MMKVHQDVDNVDEDDISEEDEPRELKPENDDGEPNQRFVLRCMFPGLMKQCNIRDHIDDVESRVKARVKLVNKIDYYF